jgi:CheY-like chemotaxis protein
MDMHMPEVDGLEATTAIRKQPGLNTNSPIIGLTASVLTRDEEVFKVAGANQVLNKPIDEGKLIDALLGFSAEQSSNSTFKGFLAGNITAQQFQLEVRKHFAEMQTSWEDKSLQRMYFYCHQLVGLVEAFGDRSMAAPLRQLHDTLQLQHYEKVEAHYLATKQAIESLLQE